MKKTLIALVLCLALASVVVAFGFDAESTNYVEPAMEGITNAGYDAAYYDEVILATEADSLVEHEEATSLSAGETSSTSEAETSQEETTAQTTAALQTASSNAATTTTKAAVPVAAAAMPQVSPQTAAATMTTNPPVSETVLYTKGNYEWLGATQATTTTTTTQYIPPTTTTTTRPPTTVTATTTTTIPPQAGPDYEAMGQTLYQDEAIRALNALRAERGLPPLTINATLMANSLAHAQTMAAAGREFHTTVNMPGCESVARIPYNFPAKLLGETLGKHTPQFLTDSRTSVGIAIVRQGNYLYAVMQGV